MLAVKYSKSKVLLEKVLHLQNTAELYLKLKFSRLRLKQVLILMAACYRAEKKKSSLQINAR